MRYAFVTSLAESKLTSQGHISVPASIRKKLGLTAGSVIEWYENDLGEISVKRRTKFNSEDIHDAVFSSAVNYRSPDELKEGIRKRMKAKFSDK